MKKKLTLSLFLLISIISYSQPLTNITGSIEVNGIPLKIGDKLIVYEPQNFQKTYEAIYGNQKLTIKKSRYTQIDDKTYDYSLSKYTIKKIKRSADGRIILSNGGIFPEYIDVKSAFNNGEVITTENLADRYKERNLLNDSLVFIHFIKRYDGETNEFWKDFLYTYQNTLYKQTHEDEFEFYGALNNTGEFLLEASEKLNNSTVYSTNIKVELDDYDFSTNSFKFLWGSGTFQLFNSSIFCKCSLDKINLQLTNLPSYESLPIGFEKAKAFIANRKNSYGNVDRDVYLWVNVLLTEELVLERKDAILKAEIQSIDVYAEKNHINGYLGTITK